MNKNTKQSLLLLSYFISILVFSYLSLHHYNVKMGLSGPGLCNINTKLNCDTAALSSYAEIFNIPIAVLGVSYSIIMFFSFLFAKLGWSDETENFKFIVRAITAISAVGSLFLLFVSASQLGVFCPFCIAGYILSFLIAFFTWSLYKDSKLSFDISAFFAAKGLLVTLAMIPVLAWFISGSARDNYGIAEIEKFIPEKIALWQSSPVYSFDESIGLSKGSADPKAIHIVEFADFKCPHCKAAVRTFKTYADSNPNVKFTFKPYPLDGTCNSHMQGGGDGSRCELAGWVLCGEKLFKKGWDIHYWIFEHQEDIQSLTDLSNPLETMSKELSLNSSELKICATSTETYELIKKSADEADLAKLTGTPTVYVGGKKLEYGQIILVLKAAIEKLP